MSTWVAGSLLTDEQARAAVLAAVERLSRVGRDRHVEVAVATYVLAHLDEVLASGRTIERVLELAAHDGEKVVDIE